ncbi:MAG TPA: NETI motif-containing protein [Sporolactobacillaceae bacterium]|nr:NETI motif-containing protein [Sporolactobacillaceae bacterium]
MTKQRKRMFSVEDYNGSVNACLEAMEKEGYTPVKRFEKPVFREGKDGPEPFKQQIVFEGVLKPEH